MTVTKLSLSTIVFLRIGGGKDGGEGVGRHVLKWKWRSLAAGSDNQSFKAIPALFATSLPLSRSTVSVGCWPSAHFQCNSDYSVVKTDCGRNQNRSTFPTWYFTRLSHNYYPVGCNLLRPVVFFTPLRSLSLLHNLLILRKPQSSRRMVQLTQFDVKTDFKVNKFNVQEN